MIVCQDDIFVRKEEREAGLCTVHTGYCILCLTCFVDDVMKDEAHDIRMEANSNYMKAVF